MQDVAQEDRVRPNDVVDAGAPLTLLAKALPLEKPIQVVDIGANPIGGPAPYKPLVDLGLAHVFGFEPQEAAFRKLQELQGERETFVQAAVGDGGAHVLNSYRSGPLSSLFKLRPEIKMLKGFRYPFGKVETFDIRTTRLDDIAEIGTIDFLKIDIQGGELAVFENGREKLKDAVAIQTEVRFFRMYEGEPTFGQVDDELARQGFEMHNLVAAHRFRFASSAVDRLPYRGGSQLLDGDMVYVRDLGRLDAMGDERLVKLALLASGVFASHDLVLACLDRLGTRGVAPPAVAEEYLNALTRRRGAAMRRRARG